MRVDIEKLKIAIVDDHNILCESLAEVLNRFQNCTVINLSKNGLDFLNLLNQGEIPDIILLDVNMPGMDGVEVCKWIKQNNFSIKVIILTMYDSDALLLQLLPLGIKAFMKKNCTKVELENAINTVSAGGFYYKQNLSDRLVSFFNTNDKGHSFLDRSLSEKDLVFIKLFSTDATYKDIAAQLQISIKTVESVKESLCFRLDVKNRIGLVIYGIKNGLISF